MSRLGRCESNNKNSFHKVKLMLSGWIQGFAIEAPLGTSQSTSVFSSRPDFLVCVAFKSQSQKHMASSYVGVNTNNSVNATPLDVIPLINSDFQTERNCEYEIELDYKLYELQLSMIASKAYNIQRETDASLFELSFES